MAGPDSLAPIEAVVEAPPTTPPEAGVGVALADSADEAPDALAGIGVIALPPAERVLVPEPVVVARLSQEIQRPPAKVLTPSTEVLRVGGEPSTEGTAQTIPEAAPVAEAAPVVEAEPAAASAEPVDIAAARKRIGERTSSSEDLKAVAAYDSDIRSQQEIQDAYAAVANNTATETQRLQVTRDTEKREKAATDKIADRKADFADLKAKKDSGEPFDPADKKKYDEYEAEKGEWEDLNRKAEAGETLTDDDRAKLEEGNKMWKEDADGETDILNETEEAKLERMQAELEATTEEMLSTDATKDPDKKAELMNKVAELRAETLGMKQTMDDKERDKKVLREAFAGKREGGLVNNETQKKNERVRELLDQMLADAAELLTIERRLKAMEAQRKQIIAKIKSGTSKLGRSSSDIDKYKLTTEGVALYRQLNSIDETMENTSEASINFAQRYYKNLSEVRRKLKVQGAVMRVLETVGFGVMRASLGVERHSKRTLNLFS